MDILPPDTIVERRAGGTFHARSPHALGAYPRAITDRLDYWAAHAPARTFLARRGPDGGWVCVTYREASARVRALAQALLDRRLSVERPLAILSGNSLEHGLLALAAMYCGVPHAPLAPAYALLAREYTTLRVLWRTLTPGLVFVDDGPRFARALSAVGGPGEAEIVTCRPAGGRLHGFRVARAYGSDG